jgi:hypothetical protein
MNLLRFKLALIAPAVLLSSFAAGGGCDNSDDGTMVGGHAYPPTGSYVYVQFRRDYLGLASEKPTTPMGEGMGMSLGSSGTLKRINEEFVVLGVDGDAQREIWIPRGVILLLDVKRTK